MTSSTKGKVKLTCYGEIAAKALRLDRESRKNKDGEYEPVVWYKAFLSKKTPESFEN